VRCVRGLGDGGLDRGLPEGGLSRDSAVRRGRGRRGGRQLSSRQSDSRSGCLVSSQSYSYAVSANVPR
jgi:hypothetical protein